MRRTSRRGGVRDRHDAPRRDRRAADADAAGDAQPRPGPARWKSATKRATTADEIREQFAAARRHAVRAGRSDAGTSRQRDGAEERAERPAAAGCEQILPASIVTDARHQRSRRVAAAPKCAATSYPAPGRSWARVEGPTLRQPRPNGSGVDDPSPCSAARSHNSTPPYAAARRGVLRLRGPPPLRATRCTKPNAAGIPDRPRPAAHLEAGRGRLPVARRPRRSRTSCSCAISRRSSYFRERSAAAPRSSATSA